MKVKNIILLPTLIIALAGCSTNATSLTSNDSNENISSSNNNESSGINDSGFHNSSTLPVSYFQFSVDGVHELRKPSETQRISYAVYSSESFVNFRNKMKAFANKLNDAFVKRYFKNDDNFIFSPLSIELCLGLAIKSSNGETRNELLNALDMDYETFNANYKNYFSWLNHTVINNMDYVTSQLLLTNSIWIDDDISLKENGLDALRDDYYCYSYDVDFNSQNANQAIREFINQSTKGLIDPELNLSPYTLFVLMNTLYVKDIWNDLGRDLNYAPNEYRFVNSDGSKSNKQLLNGYYFEGKTITTSDYSSFFTATNNGYRLYFVKPNAGKNLKDVFSKDVVDYVLNKDSIIYKDDEKMETYETKCYFPEFNVAGNFELKQLFQEDLNINKIFSPSTCDMSCLTDATLFCDEVVHIAKLDVNKSGIEGAAVTYMAYPGDAGPGPYTLVQDTFVVDKEFGFVLTYGDAVVFSGIVNNIDK